MLSSRQTINQQMRTYRNKEIKDKLEKILYNILNVFFELEMPGKSKITGSGGCSDSRLTVHVQYRNRTAVPDTLRH